MPPASGWPNVMTLAREERVKLVHSHSRHVEGRDVHMWSVSHPRLGHICCVGATVASSLTVAPWASVGHTRVGSSG